MNCANCGAALPTDSDVCAYCGTRNDTDLARLRAREAGWTEAAARPCPRCGGVLKGMRLDLRGTAFAFDRCAECLGMFFAPAEELEELLRLAAPHFGEIDFQRLARLAEDRGKDWPVRYIPCPCCGEPMLRRNYGRVSGVVVDQCRAHGIWLDGGELGRILVWLRAGGRKRGEEIERRETEARAKRERDRAKAGAEIRAAGLVGAKKTKSANLDPLLDALAQWIHRL